MLRLEVTMDDELTPRLERLVRQRLAAARNAVVQQAAERVLADTIFANPVDTARSRAAWVAALEQLGGTPPAQWRGESPTAEAEGRALGTGTRQEDRDTTEIRATNDVEYVPFLEYGTRQMAPVGMVRRSLSGVRSLLTQLLRRALRS